jgi:hypothetical protein
VATGLGLISSFDFINIDRTDISNATLKLNKLTIESIPKPF